MQIQPGCPLLSTAAAWDASGAHSACLAHGHTWKSVGVCRATLERWGMGASGHRLPSLPCIQGQGWCPLYTVPQEYSHSSGNSGMHLAWDSSPLPCFSLPGPPFVIPVITSKYQQFAHKTMSHVISSVFNVIMTHQVWMRMWYRWKVKDELIW